MQNVMLKNYTLDCWNIWGYTW